MTLSGGKDEVDSISNIIDTASSDVTDVATITISGADSDTLTGSGSVLLQGAQDATDGELQGNSEYVLISEATYIALTLMRLLMVVNYFGAYYRNIATRIMR